jgi:hypothetical protein
MTLRGGRNVDDIGRYLSQHLIKTRITPGNPETLSELLCHQQFPVAE